MPRKTLGQFLKTQRKARKFSLRELERLSGISNGHISLLESDAVKRPSPNHLHSLARALQVSYAELMQLAGYAVPASGALNLESLLVPELSQLSNDDLVQVRRFVDFLRSDRQ